MALPNTNRLLKSDPFEFTPATRALFIASFREIAQRHYDHCATFKRFWQDVELHPRDIRTEKDLEKVPPLMVHVFKEWDLCSVPRKEIALRLTSSGTTGQKSQMLLNQGSLDRVKQLAYTIHEELGMTSKKKVNYLCFTYDPKIAKDLGTAFTDELLTSFTGRGEVYYTFQWDKALGDFKMNEAEILETLKRFQNQKLPVRILGFPAFLVRLLKNFPDVNFNFGKESWVQTGGGWKGLANEEIAKGDFRKLMKKRLGIPSENVRDLFGMVEHGIPYVDCRLGKMHVPNYARIFIRDPKTLKILPEGETGLIEFMCSYNDSYPSPAILATDYGRLGTCKCGIQGQTLEIRGRAGVTQHKGCAIHSLETVQVTG